MQLGTVSSLCLHWEGWSDTTLEATGPCSVPKLVTKPAPTKVALERAMSSVGEAWARQWQSGW